MLIDISRTIHVGMAIYPNNPAVSIRTIQKAGEHTSALSEIAFGSHTGTHIDALSHIDPMGSGIDAYSLDQLVGPCDVIEIAHDVSVIHEVDLSQTTTSRVLIKTSNSSRNPDEFDPDFVALAEDAAQELVRRGVRLVGIDALSIKKKGVKDRVHEVLLRAGICILEGLYLADAPAGSHELICLPLPVIGIDGVPARAILRI